MIGLQPGEGRRVLMKCQERVIRGVQFRLELFRRGLRSIRLMAMKSKLLTHRLGDDRPRRRLHIAQARLERIESRRLYLTGLFRLFHILASKSGRHP